MMSKVRDEECLRQAVIGVVEAIEPPDRARLARLEHRLLARSAPGRARPLRWSMLLAGLAVGSAAAFWAADHWLAGEKEADDMTPAILQPATVPDERAHGESREVSSAETADEPDAVASAPPEDNDGTKDVRDDEDTPIIYMSP